MASDKRGKKTGAKKPSGKKNAGVVEHITDSRYTRVRVKTAKKRKISSTRWLDRQLNDPYVSEAKRLGYRSRAAFKLIEIDDKYDFLRPGQTVVDLGCAPGGWVQVAQERIGGKGDVVGIDLLEVEPIPGATLLVGDFNDDDAPERLKAELGGPVDVVLSDMAPATTGHSPTDHLRIVGLVELAIHFALEVLKPGGSFSAKVFAGGTEQSLLNLLKQNFTKVAHFKPKSSRKESAEMYVVATGFKGDGNV
ncbi:RlmE family RNA methyltransferase [Aestuariispira insulae]|uniref:Ribosomal RNA large subunit methyltransferase E n=1 Tax=Aestuariispira insulae TaxID=1461337 RepID=A0A3D9HVL9_9PROT|nr:RlmE family RNA methyltransferase [Aestuariispira insulae]RED53507.1 23S rRNA Um-2552 2'-O-methyltransferase [Aestuariispira insulae]